MIDLGLIACVDAAINGRRQGGRFAIVARYVSRAAS
jgi:hypothetical protein